MPSNFLRLAIFSLTFVVMGASAQGLKAVETANGVKRAQTRDLIQWTHTRLVFNKELERVAVGQKSTIEVDVLGSHEVLALAKEVGRTSIMVWYTDKTTETYLFSVVQDLSVLRRALRDVHPAVKIELAPDRAALVLRGQVPTVKFRTAAEAVARNYLEAGNRSTSTPSDILLQSPQTGTVAQDSNMRVSDSGAGDDKRSAAVINLIQVSELPSTREEKLTQAIRRVGGHEVIVTRIQQGDFPNDDVDTMTLTGFVDNQVVLARVLNVSARMYLGQGGNLDQSSAVRALTDEAGGLIGSRNRNSSGASSTLGSLPGAAGGGALANDIGANIGRSKIVSVADGRVLSMIEVRDLPQLRVSVQMHEVSRAQLKSWRPDLSVVTNEYDSTRPLALNSNAQTGVIESTVDNALQILGGALSNSLQVATGSYAFDLLFSLLEEEGISRTLSRPTLTVLAGETAVFRAGGEVPVPSAFAPSGLSSGDAIGANTSGVFSGTEFKSFGVELKVRAMIGENDEITLDVNPTVSLPDTLLTQQIANSSGSNLNTTAFNVRSIDTSTRLKDGQPLVIGGLVSRDLSDSEASTPGLSRIPILGKLAESSNKSDTDRELIIVVTPNIIREAKHDVGVWAFPSNGELLEWAVSAPTQLKAVPRLPATGAIR